MKISFNQYSCYAPFEPDISHGMMGPKSNIDTSCFQSCFRNVLSGERWPPVQGGGRRARAKLTPRHQPVRREENLEVAMRLGQLNRH